MKKTARILSLVLLLQVLLGACRDETASNSIAQNKAESQTYAMSTFVTQTAYGERAEEALREVNRRLAAFEERLSLFLPDSDIAKINAAAGKGGAVVSSETARFIEKALGLSSQWPNAFAVSIAPITLLWGVTGDNPRVPSQQEIDAALALVDDGRVHVEGNRVTLETQGMGLDLGGIAKGEACSLVKEVYEEYGLTGGLISIGGNVYAFGRKPDGSRFRIGFRDPYNTEGLIAAVELEDETLAVSGGYERYFEVDGEAYIHIMNPLTGRPAETDIVTVGVVHEDGGKGDFYSTALFVSGLEAALEYMREGGKALVLAQDNSFYVSAALKDGFELFEEEYEVIFVEAEAGA